MNLRFIHKTFCKNRQFFAKKHVSVDKKPPEWYSKERYFISILEGRDSLGMAKKYETAIRTGGRRRSGYSGKKKSGGYGLGLSISRRIIERHGGTLEIGESQLGGAAFVIRLPK